MNALDFYMLHRNIPDIGCLRAEALQMRMIGWDSKQPRGELAARTLAMPADTNPMGNIFGGWIMSLMDASGKVTAARHAQGRVMTVSVSNISFLQPVNVGDTVCCYTDVLRTGRSSVTLAIEVWVLRQGQGDRVKVTDAEFTFVAVNDNGRPREIEPPQAANDA